MTETNIKEVLDEILETPFMKTWILKNYRVLLNPRKLMEEGLEEFITEAWEILEQSPKFMLQLTEKAKNILRQEVETMKPKQLPALVETSIFFDEISVQVNISAVFKNLLKELKTMLTTKTEEELRDLVLKARRG